MRNRKEIGLKRICRFAEAVCMIIKIVNRENKLISEGVRFPGILFYIKVVCTFIIYPIP